MAPLTRIAAEGFSLGLATGTYCLAACAPAFVPFLLAEGGGGWSVARLVAKFLLGRLAAYAAFAVIAVWAGARFAGLLPPWVLHAAVALTALLMLAYALPLALPRPRLCAWAARVAPASRMPMLLGFLVGINLCPPFVQGLLALAGLGSVAGGLLFFLLFFLATTLYMLPLLSVAFVKERSRMKNIGMLASLLAGAWFLVKSIIGLSHS